MSRRADRGTSRWIWIVSLAATIAAALVLTFLLAIATNNREFYERYYNRLLWVNVVIAGLLVLVIAAAGLRLLLRVVRGRFGSRLLLRLAGIFALVGVLPGVLVYTVSYQFVSRSIESWFDVRVEGALDAGLNLGRGTLDALVNDLAGKTRLAAERLSESSERARPLALERLREQLSAQDAAVLGPNGQVLASAGIAGVLAPERPSSALLRAARESRVTTQVEGLDDDAVGQRRSAGGEAAPAPRVRALALIPSTSFSLGAEDHYLMITQLLPAQLAANALAVQSAYREYQQRSLAREGLRQMYIGTLTLTLILAVFGAVLLAVTFGNRLARPLLLLAGGVREVARGDLSPKPVFASRDELGGLTRSFARMTQQLADARGLVDRTVSELEAARTKLQTILDNMSAGVIVFDHEGRIDSINPGATRILRLPLSAYVGRALGEVPGLEGFDAMLAQRFEQLEIGPEGGQRDQWQDSFELKSPLPDRDAVTLLVRGAQLPGAARLTVFDDITELVSAQRAEAWGEVARRLAHEIKNPLTPIQLSAERLQHKLAAKLEAPDEAVLVKSVATIVTQVQAMKQLVNEFRDYARLPAAQLAPLDLNALVGEVLGLYAQAQEAGRLRAELAEALPLIEGDATQLRQVIHNLTQNALDAVAERPDGLVRLRTEAAQTAQAGPAQHADKSPWRVVRLIVSDNGPGFSERVLKRAFEPYVTTKSKGTGLGLAVVKKIADEHAARVRLVNLPREACAEDDAATAGGAQVSLSFSKILAPDGEAGRPAETAVATH
jgi:nitrogen fixation/metabolism regulation signal transduction histidine kinase